MMASTTNESVVKELKKPLMFFDIEADNLLYDATKIHLMICYEEQTETYHIFHTEPLDKGEEIVYPLKKYIIYNNIYNLLSYISSSYILVSYNGIGYDLPLLSKLHGFKYNLDDQIDCLLLSRLYYPDREGHSLGYWGNKLGFNKGDHTDFSSFSRDMLVYCIRDVDLTRRVYYTLEEEGKDWDWSKAIALEKKIQEIQVKQETKGVLFDTKSAVILSNTIQKRVDEVDGLLFASLPLRAVQEGATVIRPFKKDGSLSKMSEEWMNDEVF